MAKLVIYQDVDNETLFEVFDLTATRLLIGSGADNELVLESPEVGQAHLSLELRHDAWIVQDLGSAGGTMVNGRPISGPYTLHDNDTIEIGTIKLRFQETEPEAEAAAEPDEPEPEPVEPPHIRGRVWFATVAGGTVAAIFIILLLLVIADYLGLIQIIDLLPPWLLGGVGGQ